MLSDEEKKAIDNMKSLLLYSKEHEYFSPFQEQEIDDMNNVLNIVEKQSKEIEELKDKDNANIAYYDQIYQNGIYTGQKAVEDKIKAKIEELIKEGNYRTADNPNGRVHFQKEIIDYQIEVLQSLLEKE